MTSAASSRAAGGQRDLNQPRVSLASPHCSNSGVFSGSTSTIQSSQLRFCNLIRPVLYIRGKRTQKVSFNFPLCPQLSTIFIHSPCGGQEVCAGVWYEWWWYMQSKICPRVHLKCPLPGTGQPQLWSIQGSIYLAPTLATGMVKHTQMSNVMVLYI